MTRSFAAVAAVAFAVAACGGDTPTTSSLDQAIAPSAASQAVVNRVSAGGNDVCAAFGLPNGCDANWSLSAVVRADGSMSGQMQDGFAGGGEGVHIAIDCVNVSGNEAVVSGVITKGQAFGNDVTGAYAVAAVVDNGTSANDPPDEISFTVFPFGASCFDVTVQNFRNAGFLFPLGSGQVTVN